MVYLMRRLALDMRHPESLEIAVNKFALEESTIDRASPLACAEAKTTSHLWSRGLVLPTPAAR